MIFRITSYNVCYTKLLRVSIAGPAFTILLAIIFLLIIEKYKTLYAYPVVFFQAFLRFCSLVFGGFAKQDEARISEILGIGTYTFAIIVLLILFVILFRASRILKVSFKTNCYYFTISTVCELLVICTYKIIA